MDILSQYEQEHPKASAQQPIYGSAAPSEGFLIRTVMKLSGGKVQNRKQALIVLLIIGSAGLLASVVLIFQSTGITQHPFINAPPPETIRK